MLRVLAMLIATYGDFILVLFLKVFIKHRYFSLHQSKNRTEKLMEKVIKLNLKEPSIHPPLDPPFKLHLHR